MVVYIHVCYNHVCVHVSMTTKDQTDILVPVSCQNEELVAIKLMVKIHPVGKNCHINTQ